jgi:hypothetical protein
MRLSPIRCSCSEVVLKSSSYESKIRSKILVIKGDSVFAICKGCSKEVRLPLQVDKDVVNPPLFIKDH